MTVLLPAVTDRKRTLLEHAIRVTDLCIYVFVLAAAVWGFIFTPTSIARALHPWDFLIIMWNVLLLIGGFGGFAGRLYRLWAIETPAAAAGTFGTAIYAVVLASTSFGNPIVWVATFLMFVAMFTCIRRWLELQIFLSDPEDVTLIQRLRKALRRRTPLITERF